MRRLTLAFCCGQELAARPFVKPFMKKGLNVYRAR
jgi:hypothetical protein